MPRIEPLNVLISVVDNRSFTRAAEALGLTPSAVSKQISQLEERLGARLLHRTTRSVAPTEAGQLYYHRCLQILEALDEAEIQIRALDQAPQGALRVMAQPFFGRAALARIFNAFRLRFPDVHVDLTVTETAPVGERDTFDVSIQTEPPSDARLVSKQLADLPTVLCAATTYLAEHGHPTTEAALAGHAFIEITAPVGLKTPTWSDRRSMIVNDVDLAFNALREGMGVGVLPQYLVRADLERGRVEALLTHLDLPRQNVWVSYPELRHQSPKTRALVEFLEETLRPAASARAPEG